MTKLTIDLDNYSEADQELIQSIWRKFKPVDKKRESHACDGLTYSECGYDMGAWVKMKEDIFVKNYPEFEKSDMALILGIDNQIKGVGLKEGAIAKNARTEDPIWKPVDTESYHLLHSDSTLDYMPNEFRNDKYDLANFEVGNVFKTKEAAQRMLDRRRRIGIFENKMMGFSDGYDESMNKYRIIYNGKQWTWIYEDECTICPLVIYINEGVIGEAVEWANKHYPEGV